MTGVAVMEDHVLRLPFSDGTVGNADLSAERWTEVLEPLSDPASFALVTARLHGTQLDKIHNSSRRRDQPHLS